MMKKTKSGDAASDGDVESNGTDPAISAPAAVLEESITTTVKNYLIILWNWSVIISMSVLPSILPFYLLWVAFAVSFAISVLVLCIEGARYQRGQIKVYPKHIDVGLSIINLALFIAVYVSPPPSSWRYLLYLSAVVNGCLFAFAMTTLVVDTPFTLQFAMEKVDEAHWNAPTFRSINYTITSVWASMWGVTTLYDVLVSVSIQQNGGDVSDVFIIFNKIVPIALLVAAFRFTAWYPAHARAAVQSQAAAGRDDAIDIQLIYS